MKNKEKIRLIVITVAAVLAVETAVITVLLASGATRITFGHESVRQSSGIQPIELENDGSPSEATDSTSTTEPSQSATEGTAATETSPTSSGKPSSTGTRATTTSTKNNSTTTTTAPTGDNDGGWVEGWF